VSQKMRAAAPMLRLEACQIRGGRSRRTAMPAKMGRMIVEIGAGVGSMPTKYEVADITTEQIAQVGINVLFCVEKGKIGSRE